MENSQKEILQNERVLFESIGQLTRSVHDMIRNSNLTIETPMPGADDDGNSDGASNNLSYVIELTENAANNTMDMVEKAFPIVDDITDGAVFLRKEWTRFKNKELSAQEFRELYERISNFLDATIDKSHSLNDQIKEILLAQEYQDLTGQIIKKVITSVKEVESELVKIVKTASELDELAGIKHEKEVDEEEDRIKASGPSLKGDSGSVSNQDEVDDLLSSLGF